MKDTDNPVFLRRKKLSKKKKLVAREVEEKKRRAAEKERRDAEVESVAPNGDGRRHQQDQYLKKKRMKELKNIAREKVKQNRRELEDNYLRSQMVEKRRMRIAELAMAKVLHYLTVDEWDIAFTPVSA